MRGEETEEGEGRGLGTHAWVSQSHPVLSVSAPRTSRPHPGISAAPLTAHQEVRVTKPASGPPRPSPREVPRGQVTGSAQWNMTGRDPPGVELP